MNDYSDLIFLMGAMVMFSLLTLNVSRNMVMNTKQLSQSEVEYNAVSLAQGVLDRAQWASKEELNPDNTGTYIFSGYTKSDPYKKTLELGSSGQYKIDFYIYVTINNDISVSGSTTNNKKVTVHVTSPYFYEDFDLNSTDYPVTMSFITAFEG